jgi:hypothetical protein
LPLWFQATSAVIGAVLATAGVVLAFVQLGDEEPERPTSKPEAFIEQVAVDSDQVVANGRFRLVDLSTEVILFVRRAEISDEAPWLPVEASATADEDASGERVDGRWDASFPLNEQGSFVWQVLVVAAVSGVGDVYADIRKRGPDSQLVLAASEVFRTGG